MGEETTEIKPPRGLTLRTLILVLLTIFILTPLSVITFYYTDKPGTYCSFGIPFIIWICVNELIGRANRKWRLTPQELAILFIPWFVIIGKAYIATGASGRPENLVNMEYNWLFFLYGLFNDPYKDIYWQFTPSFIAPKDPALIAMFNLGKKAGEVIPWGAWLIPILWSETALAVWAFAAMFIVYGIIGPQWVEIERLPFLMAVPTTYAIKAAEASKQTNKGRLFDFSFRETKIFWIAFIAGIAFSFAPMMAEVFPVIPAGGGWGEITVDFPQLPSIIGPGIQAHSVFIVHQSMLFLLVANDVLYTSIIIWLVFGVIYQTLGVRMGFLPYQEGVEMSSNWFYGYLPPFPYCLFACLGIGTAVSIRCIYAARGRIKRLFDALLGKSDAIEEGVSLKFLAWGFVLTSLIFIIFWAGSGTGVAAAIVLWVTWFIWQIVHARVQSEVWWHDPTYWFHYWYWIYPMGLGWKVGEVPTTSSQWFMTSAAITVVGGWCPRHHPLSSGFQSQLYYLLRTVRVNLKDAIITTALVIIIGGLIARFTLVWALCSAGGLKTTWYGSYVPGYTVDKYVMTTAAKDPRLSFTDVYIWTIVGIVVGFILYAIRARFPWFVINPVAAIPAFWLMEHMWLSSIAALIAKIALMRALGAKRYSEYITPFAAGLLLGYGVLYVIPMLVNFFSVVLPHFFSYYTP